MTLPPILPVAPAPASATDPEPTGSDGARFQQTLTEAAGRYRADAGRSGRTRPADARVPDAKDQPVGTDDGGSGPASAEPADAGSGGGCAVDAVLLVQAGVVTAPAPQLPAVPVPPAPTMMPTPTAVPAQAMPTPPIAAPSGASGMPSAVPALPGPVPVPVPAGVPLAAPPASGAVPAETPATTPPVAGPALLPAAPEGTRPVPPSDAEAPGLASSTPTTTGPTPSVAVPNREPGQADVDRALEVAPAVAVAGTASTPAPLIGRPARPAPAAANPTVPAPSPVVPVVTASVAGSAPRATDAGDPSPTPDTTPYAAAATATPASAAPAATGSAAAPAAAPDAGPPAPVPDQVLRHLESVRALRDGGHRTVLRLEPDHLGAVTVTVDVRAGAVRMAVTGGSQALAAVREGIAHLRSALADAGLDLGDVALRPDAVQAPASASGAATSPDGQGTANGPRPDRGGQGADAGDRRPAQRHDQGPATGPDRPDPIRPVHPRHAPDPVPEGPAGIRRLDVRV